MLKGRDIVCFAGRWDGEPSTATQVMSILARENRVLWVDGEGGALRRLFGAMQGLREPQRNLWVLSPPSLPFEGRGLVQAANAALLRLSIGKAMRELRIEDAISWCFSPAAARIAGTLGESLLVRHCVDEPPDRLLLLKADLVLCSSERQREAGARFNPNVHLVQPGADLAHFGQACDPATPVSAELKGLPGPIVGFWGPIDDRVDLQLVRYVADAFSGGTVVLLGDAATSTKPLDGARNVRVLGRRPYAELPRFARGFDVALLPLKEDPVEVRDYLAAGLPVVSTAIPEVERLGLCRVGRDADGVVREIAAAVAAGPGPDAARAARLHGQGWGERVAQMEEIVTAALRGRARHAA